MSPARRKAVAVAGNPRRPSTSIATSRNYQLSSLQLRLALSRYRGFTLLPLDSRARDSFWPYAWQVCLWSCSRLPAIRTKPAEHSRTPVRDILTM